MLTFLIALVAGNVALLVYQLGHVVTARLFGVKVESLFVGIGPELGSITLGQTRVVFGLFPLGSYAHMGGVDAEIRAWVLGTSWKPSRGDLLACRAWVRALVLAGGSGAMIVLACLIFSSVAALQGVPEIAETRLGRVDSIGLPIGAAPLGRIPTGATILRVGDASVTIWSDVRRAITGAPAGVIEIETDQPALTTRITVTADPAERREIVSSLDVWMPASVGGTAPGGPASLAGLQAGDQILSLDEEPVLSWWHFVELVQARPSRPVSLLLERSGSRVVREVNTDARSVTDSTGQVTQIGVVGVFPGALPVEYRAIPLVDAARGGVAETWAVTGLVLRWLADLVTGDVDLTSLGGMLSSGAGLASAVAVDFYAVLRFSALGAVNTALLMLVIPFPPLPGGHLFLLLLEVANREPLSIETRLNLTWLGVFCLGTVVLIGQFNDVIRSLGGF